MRKYKLLAVTMMMVTGLCAFSGCNIKDFDPTVFMTQQTETQATDEAEDKVNNETDTSSLDTNNEVSNSDTVMIVCDDAFLEKVSSLEGIKDNADINVQTLEKKYSSMTGDSYLLAFSKDILAKLESASTNGIVIAADKNSVEELAFMLECTEKSDKPVVFVSLQENAENAESAESIYSVKTDMSNAIAVASEKSSKDRGVLVLDGELIYLAKDFNTQINRQKAVGTVSNGTVTYISAMDKKNSNKEKIDITSWKSMPQVAIVYDYIDMDTMILENIFSLYDGVVIAASDNGSFSDNVEKFVTESKNKPYVVRTSKSENSAVTRNIGYDDDANNTIAAGKLSAVKSRILLSLCIGDKKDESAIGQSFDNMQ